MPELYNDRLYDASQVRELDRLAIGEAGIAGLTLMKRAAAACVSTLLGQWPQPGRVAVLCGAGNNAGDGFIIAGLLANRGITVTVGLVGKAPAAGSDARAACEFCEQSGVPMVAGGEALARADLIVDALLGTGLKGAVRADYLAIIAGVNGSGRPVLSVDLPSGLCADTGSVLGGCVKATVTVTFIGRKLGLMTNDGPEYAGRLVFADLDVPAAVYERAPWAARLLSYEQVVAGLGPRHKNAHKRDHGHLLVIGGDHGMTGAVSMAAEAAMFTGAGMVTAATRPGNVAALVARRPEVMAKGVTTAGELQELVTPCHVVLIGPGLGQSAWSRMLFEAVAPADRPMVIDAGGLDFLADNPRRRDNRVLTPHPGEARRLLGAPVQEDRPGAVIRLQREFGGAVLLKGAGTLIAGPGREVSLCPYGNPGMSAAGMGDVLAGVIAGLLAQGLGPGAAAELGAVVHSLAADRIAASQGERGLLATELLPEIRRLINGLP